jgi:inulin fructotransferase (DFA-I-forming)
MPTVYDVTTFAGSVSPYVDVGTVMNEIIADIKAQQTTQTTRPGAVIYIPPGHYDLKTRVVIDISHLQIKGSGHGFLSQAIRDETNTTGWFETLPGGSHIRQLNSDGKTEAFLISRAGSPGTVGRLNSVEFRDFCINGVAATKPYAPGNNKIAISVASDNDSFRIEGMGFCYVRTALRIKGADALTITNNFIAECGSCIELVSGSIVAKITNNYLISAWGGSAIFIENGDNHLIQGNSIVWNARIHLKNTQRVSIASNKFLSNWPGMVNMEGTCNDNLVTGNHFTRVDVETAAGSNSHDDLFGMVHVSGNNNAVMSNIFSYRVATNLIKPAGATPTIVLVAAGADNFVATNHITSSVPTKIIVDGISTGTRVIHSARAAQFQSFTTNHVFVATP